MTQKTAFNFQSKTCKDTMSVCGWVGEGERGHRRVVRSDKVNLFNILHCYTVGCVCVCVCVFSTLRSVGYYVNKYYSLVPAQMSWPRGFHLFISTRLWPSPCWAASISRRKHRAAKQPKTTGTITVNKKQPAAVPTAHWSPAENTSTETWVWITLSICLSIRLSVHSSIHSSQEN